MLLEEIKCAYDWHKVQISKIGIFNISLRRFFQCVCQCKRVDMLYLSCLRHWSACQRHRKSKQTQVLVAIIRTENWQRYYCHPSPVIQKVNSAELWLAHHWWGHDNCQALNRRAQQGKWLVHGAHKVKDSLARTISAHLIVSDPWNLPRRSQFAHQNQSAILSVCSSFYLQWGGRAR